MEKSTFLTPVGRLVAGSPFNANDKDHEGNPLLTKSGANAGQPRVEYFMALAIPKTDPGYAALYAIIAGEAKASFPSLFDAAGACILPTFAFKITDGDSAIPNTKGKKPCDREGYPGNWILSMSSGYAPKCYTTGGKELLTDPNSIKRGCYIRVHGSVAGNRSDSKPGVYLNHSMVEFIAYGAEISAGPSGESVFGGAPVALPAGASATPLAPATPLAAPVERPVATTAPTTTPAAMPSAPDFLAPPAAPAPAPKHVMLAPAGGASYETMISAGWTDETLRANGMMA